MLSKADKYIELVADMYNLSNDVKEKIGNNTDLIDKELENYTWEDIKWAVQKFYTHKNDKTYPKLCHVLAILDATGKKMTPIYEEPMPDIVEPNTNVREIQDIVKLVCELLYTEGIFWNEYFAKVKNLPFGNKTYIDNKTGRIMNKQWIWDDAVDRLIRNYPQEYNKFRYLSLIEKYVLAYKWGCYNAKDYTKGIIKCQKQLM